MDKKFINTALAAVMGILFLSVLFSLFSLVMDCILTTDLIEFQGGSKTLDLARWSAVALVCVLVPTIVCYGFSIFGTQKVFNLTSAILSFFIALCCLTFLFVIRDKALNTGASTYASVTGFFQEYISITVTTLILGTFYTVKSVFDFKRKDSENKMGETENEEI